MSIKAITRVWETSQQRGSALLMLLAIADYAKDDGTGAWPSLGTLARKTRMSRRNAIKIIQKLEEAGELTVRRKEGPHGTNFYDLTFQVVNPSSPPKSGAGEPQFTPPGEPQFTSLVNPSSPDPSLNVSDPSYADAPEKNSQRLIDLPENDPRRLGAALGLTAQAQRGKALEGWQPRSAEVETALIAFIETTRVTPPRKKSERVFWENEIQDHILDYGLDRLEEWYRRAAEECRDAPLREGRRKDVVSIKSPKSIRFKLIEYAAEDTLPAVDRGEAEYWSRAQEI